MSSITEISSVRWFDLNLDRKLLDSSFEGYKLSLEPFAQYKLEMNNQLELDTYNFVEHNKQDSIDESNSEHKVFVYQHLKLYGLQNLLIVNQFKDSNVYYFDSDHRLIQISYNSNRSLVPTNLKLSGCSQTDRVNPTMRFINENTSVIFDGFQKLYACHFEDQLCTILFEWQATEELTSSLLKDATFFENKLHVILMNVREVKNKFETFINWLTFERTTLNSFELKRTRCINCFNSVPEYLSLETNGQSIYLTGPSLIKFVYDSEKPVISATKASKSTITSEAVSTTQVQEEGKKIYCWNQTGDEINITVRLDGNEIKSKNDVVVSIKLDSIDIKTQNDTILMNGRLFSAIKVDESLWTLNTENKTLEILLVKSQPSEVWYSCLKEGDQFGEYKSEQMDQLFTSDTPAKGNESKSVFSTLDQQLEECDGIDDDQTMGNLDSEEKFIMIRRLDGDSHEASHQAFINDNKFLFDVKLNPSQSSALCLRHDVDGIVWQPHRVSEPSPANTVWLTHEHTFLAFGYVQASKQDTKYRSCSPDLTYVCIADTLKHIYVYRQDSESQGMMLKNRKTGKFVNQIGKQYLISLDTDKECFGIYCSNDYLIVLLRNFCYLFRMSSK